MRNNEIRRILVRICFQEFLRLTLHYMGGARGAPPIIWFWITSVRKNIRCLNFMTFDIEHIYVFIPNFKSTQAFSGLPGAEKVKNTPWEVGLTPILPGFGVLRKLFIITTLKSTTFECFLRNVSHNEVLWKYLADLITQQVCCDPCSTIREETGMPISKNAVMRMR